MDVSELVGQLGKIPPDIVMERHIITCLLNELLTYLDWGLRDGVNFRAWSVITMSSTITFVVATTITTSVTVTVAITVILTVAIMSVASSSMMIISTVAPNPNVQNPKSLNPAVGVHGLMG